MYEIPPVFSNFVNIGLDCSCPVKTDTVIRKILYDNYQKDFPKDLLPSNDPIPLFVCTAAHKRPTPSPVYPSPITLCIKGGRLVLAACMHKASIPFIIFPFPLSFLGRPDKCA